MTKVIIDTDPGTDDALALMMALNSDRLDIQGLTTIADNASLKHTTKNTLALIQYLGESELPVAKGASSPIGGGFQYAYDYHGITGLTVDLPTATLKPKRISASRYIINLAKSLPEELVLIALGH